MAARYKYLVRTEPGRNTRSVVMRDEKGELPHFCFPLVDPRWVEAPAAGHMRADDPVLGLEFDGRAWALPWWIMKNHHVANLELAGRPVLVTLCEACSSGGAFDPVLDGRRLNFHLEGLYNGTIMPKDYETGSRWTGFTGEAISGPLQGRVMERLPLLQCTWEEWLAVQPRTLVPDGEGESRVGHGEGYFPGGPRVVQGFSAMLTQIDRRLPHYELVLGVLAGGESRCYPLATLDGQGRALNDRLGDVEIVVLSRPGTWMAAAYERVVDGVALSFATQGEAIVDEQSGSRWEMSGVASSGRWKGRQLRYVHSGIEEFHIWAAFHPGTGIHGATWSAEAMPEALRALLQQKWWTPGSRMLDVECGEGVGAAWAAESNLKALGVDPDPARIAQARRRFGRLPDLRYEVADLSRSAPFRAEFDAMLDSRLYARLGDGERAAYVKNLATAAKPGARLLLIAPDAATAERARAELAGAFHFVDQQRSPEGFALRLLRSGWLA